MKQNNMKKFLVLSLFLFLMIGAHAQGRIEAGVKAGLSLSDVNLTGIDFDWSSKMDIGFAYGIYGKLKLTKKLAFQPEFYFANKRYIVTEVDEQAGITNETRKHRHLNEWELPMLFTYDVKTLDKYNIYVLLGPSVSFVHGDGSSNNLVAQDPYWNGMAGFGVKYGRLAADLRYERNFYDFYKYQSGLKNRDLNANVVSLNVSFNFLGKRELKR